MGTGYTRNDTSNNIADGNIINAADLDGEFDAIESAFGTSGHTHDGTSAEGGPITVLGPVQDFVASATEIKPKTTNTLDIGTNSLLFKDMYLDGVATLGSIKIDNAGTIGSASDGDAIAISSGGVVSFSQNTIGKTGSGYVLSLQTSDTTIEATNVLGKIEFSAPDEASGTDAILVGASIEALAEATFDSSTNSTALVFKTNTTGAATERMRLTSAGDLHFLDNRKAIFGAGSDLQIYHDGSNSYVGENGTGDLRLTGNSITMLKADATETYAQFVVNGAVNLYYDNSQKLATTSTGVDITGTAVTDGLTVAGNVSVDGGTIKLDGNYPTGTGNVALGEAALDDGSLSGGNNVAIGSSSLTSNTSGASNTAVGQFSQYSNTTGSNNSVVGDAALAFNTTGGSNTAVGKEALRSNTTASGNTAVGYQASYSNTTGAQNVGLGYQALYDATTANFSTAVGYQAASNLTTGAHNIAIGRHALLTNTTGASNVAVGNQALNSNTTASNNTAVGYEAGYSNTTGATNSAFGRLAFYSNTTGSENTAIGEGSLYDNTTGNYNVAVGKESLVNNTTASHNTAVGYFAGYSVTTGLVSAFGSSVLKNNSTGSYNTGLGGRGSDNYSTLNENTTGSYNVAVGHGSLARNTTASNNTAVGYQAAYSATTASDITAIGWQAGYSATGTASTYIGSYAGQTTTGINNTFLGHTSGYLVTSGTRNTIIGKYNGNQGGLDIRTSSNNIVLSDGDGNPFVRVTSFSFNYQTGSATTVDASNPDGVSLVKYTGQGIVRVGNTATGGRNVIEFYNGNGNVGNVTTSGSSTAYNTSSDYRLKENVVDLTGATDRLKQLEPKRFNFIVDDTTTVDGFLAHEVQAVVPEAVTGTKDAVDDDGNPVYQGIDQSKLVPLLVATIQELEARITALENA